MRSGAADSVTLFSVDGRRKYLTPAERQRFMEVAADWPRAEVGTLCLTLAHTGCRISEALALTPSSIDSAEGYIAIRSLKKRGLVVFRLVPVPPCLIERLRMLKTANEPNDDEVRLWPLSRGRAWQLVKAVMRAADVAPGPHMTPKGLRHGFGIHAIRSGVPLNMLQRWLGHASLTTTAIYASAVGPEEHEIASRMWNENERIP